MNRMILIMVCGLWMCSCADASYDEAYWSDGQVIERGIPAPLPEHPGNVYLDTEEVWVKIPPETPKEVKSWRALDDNRRTV